MKYRHRPLILAGWTSPCSSPSEHERGVCDRCVCQHPGSPSVLELKGTLGTAGQASFVVSLSPVRLINQLSQVTFPRPHRSRQVWFPNHSFLTRSPAFLPGDACQVDPVRPLDTRGACYRPSPPSPRPPPAPTSPCASPESRPP